jgi:hypothetical protein
MPLIVDRGGTSIDLVFVYPAMPEREPRQAFPRTLPSGRVELQRQGNTINAATRGVKKFKLLFSPEQFDFMQPIRVMTNGVVAFEGTVPPSVETLLRWAALDQDRTLLFGADLDVAVKAR